MIIFREEHTTRGQPCLHFIPGDKIISKANLLIDPDEKPSAEKASAEKQSGGSRHESEDGGHEKGERTPARREIKPDSENKYEVDGILELSDNGFGFLRTLRLPSTLLAIGDYAFSSCKRLKGVELPDMMKIIKQGAFSNCESLSVIKIPKGILEIEDNTFQFCRSLETVEIPPTVGSI